MGGLGILIIGFSSMGIQTVLELTGLAAGVSAAISLVLAVVIISLYTYLLFNYDR